MATAQQESDHFRLFEAGYELPVVSCLQPFGDCNTQPGQGSTSWLRRSFGGVRPFKAPSLETERWNANEGRYAVQISLRIVGQIFVDHPKYVLRAEGAAPSGEIECVPAGFQ
jgi:hypothetical protein